MVFESARRRLAGTVSMFVLALGCATAVAQAQSVGSGSARLTYKVNPVVKMTVVPNYQSGYGPIGGAGSGVSVAAGPQASASGGFVDFGNVVAGYYYLYRYAAQLAVTTNDSAGFVVYGEGSTDFNGAGTFPIAQTLFWLPSTTGNGPFTPATPFQKTAGVATGGGTGINYVSLPSSNAIVWTGTAPGTQTKGFDYQLHLDPSIATSQQWSVYVVYTAVGN